jgi:hypothetical protein
MLIIGISSMVASIFARSERLSRYLLAIGTLLTATLLLKEVLMKL